MSIAGGVSCVLRKLIKLYQSDPLSRWHQLRYATQQNHINLLRQIDRRYGRTKLNKIKGRTLLKWHAEWLDGTKYSAARAFIKKIRVLFGFGLTILEDKDTERITAEQAIAVRRRAWQCGWGSVALAQSLQSSQI